MTAHEPIPDPVALLAEALEMPPDSIPEDADITTMARWDSFKHLNLMLRLEESYGVEISEESIARFRTLAAIRDRYKDLIAASENPERRADRTK